MGFTFDGKIKSYDIKLYSNAGNTMDVSKKVGLFFYWTLHRYFMELWVESARCDVKSINSTMISLRHGHSAGF